MQTKDNKISTCLWFDDQAGEAAKLYTSVFKNSRILDVNYYNTETPSNKPKGSVLTTVFELEGQTFMALNGGPMFKPNPSISFFVVCETEAETIELWQKLSDGGSVLMELDKYDWSEKYGWVQDRFGISWQIAQGKIEETGQKITPSLLFVNEQLGKAEEAINNYVSVFEHSSITGIMRYEKNEKEQLEGSVKHAQFKLNEQTFMAMESNSDHPFSFNEAISFVVACETQEEVDYYWQKLSAVPQSEQCGWLKDEYGVSWQIVPRVLQELLKNPDPKKSKRVMEAMLKMKKLDIEKLKEAAKS